MQRVNGETYSAGEENAEMKSYNIIFNKINNNKANNSFPAKQDKDYELFRYPRRNGNV